MVWLKGWGLRFGFKLVKIDFELKSIGLKVCLFLRDLGVRRGGSRI